MNKKYMYSFVALLAVSLVSAGIIQYYGQVTQNINIESPISVDGLTPATITGMLQSPVLGELVTVTNNAEFDVDVEVESNTVETGVSSNSDLITTSYVNKLRLSKKVVVWNTNNWAEVSDTNVMVEYNVVGDTLLAEVADEDKVTNYVLIYYADNADRFNNVEKALYVGNVDASLPYEGDENAEGYNYCIEEEEYATCYGAKIWYVPSDAIDSNRNIDWDRANEFYFETDLIHYFKTVDGETTISGGVSMEFYPEYEFGAIEGNYIVTTSVKPVAA